MDSVKLHPAFYLHICFFQFCGLCPTPLHRSSDRKRLIALKLISTAHLAGIVVQIVAIIHFHEYIFFARDTFGRFNSIFKYFGGIVACFSIAVESFMKRQEHAQFWNRLFVINLDYAHQSGAFVSGQDIRIPLHRQYYVIFYGFWALVVFVELNMFIMRETYSFNFWSIYLISLMMSRTQYLQYILYVDTLDIQIGNLQTELEKVVEYSKLRRLATGDPFNESALKFICKKLKWSQRHYTKLYEMSLNVNEAFGWSQLANFFHSFVQLLSELYWNYWRFYVEFETFDFAYIELLIPTFFIFVLVLQRANKCHLRAQNIAFLVHSIKRTTVNTSLTTLIESFSLQLLHQPIIFNAKGFFILNLNPLRDMIAAITTYMVFSVQFSPKFKKRSMESNNIGSNHLSTESTK